jgi:hypothetical protein
VVGIYVDITFVTSVSLREDITFNKVRETLAPAHELYSIQFLDRFCFMSRQNIMKAKE